MIIKFHQAWLLSHYRYFNLIRNLIKICSAWVYTVLNRSQWNFAHITTVLLSWQVQIFIVIGWLYIEHEEYYKIPDSNRTKYCLWDGHQAPVPLSIFRSNSKFDENSERSSFKYIRPITTIFCTRHDSDTVVTCAKYRCDRPRILYTRVFWIFIEFRIRSKYA